MTALTPQQIKKAQKKAKKAKKKAEAQLPTGDEVVPQPVNKTPDIVEASEQMKKKKKKKKKKRQRSSSSSSSSDDPDRPREPANPLQQAWNINIYKDLVSEKGIADPDKEKTEDIFAKPDVDVARKPMPAMPEWDHVPFVMRSPSPDRTRTDGTFADTKRGAWRSKAGGVFLPPVDEPETLENSGRFHSSSPARYVEGPVRAQLRRMRPSPPRATSSQRRSRPRSGSRSHSRSRSRRRSSQDRGRRDSRRRARSPSVIPQRVRSESPLPQRAK
mmetsp:Transcript_11932/g.26509  ORF Transcript_11932/g.26509 Transcript_11932/m.26509 type:complete len:273 (-) Transcript_11932:7-825(-)